MNDSTNKKFWQRFAFLYGRFMKKNDDCYDGVSEIAKCYLDKNKKVLELACGTGQLSFRLAEFSSQWIATDYSPNMIDEAKKIQGPENLSFEVADGTNLIYENQSFDVVLIANALHIVPEPEKILMEIKRVLKNEGVLIAPTFVYDKGYKKLKIWFMEKAGFKTFNKWTSLEYKKFVEEKGFKNLDFKILDGNPLKECLFVGKRF